MLFGVRAVSQDRINQSLRQLQERYQQNEDTPEGYAAVMGDAVFGDMVRSCYPFTLGDPNFNARPPVAITLLCSAWPFLPVLLERIYCQRRWLKGGTAAGNRER